MMVRLLSNGVDVVLIERPDRLARDVVESEIILRDFRKAGVRVVECEGGNDLTAGDGSNPTAKLIRQMFAALAEWEKDSSVMKLRAAWVRKRRETGRCEGPKPYGELPGEADVLTAMRRLRRKPRGGDDSDRRSFGLVADRLNEAGHPTRSGRPWSRGTVHKVLSR